VRCVELVHAPAARTGARSVCSGADGDGGLLDACARGPAIAGVDSRVSRRELLGLAYLAAAVAGGPSTTRFWIVLVVSLAIFTPVWLLGLRLSFRRTTR